MFVQQLQTDYQDIKERKKHKKNIVSLFSGCGGLDLGFVLYNYNELFRILWANDIDPSACDTYSKNFRCRKYDDPTEHYARDERIFCGDIKDVKFIDAVGTEEIDVVVGGPPCSDFSLLRGDEGQNRMGIKVQRGKLYLDFVRALIELEPKVFVMENVQGLVSANRLAISGRSSKMVW